MDDPQFHDTDHVISDDEETNIIILDLSGDDSNTTDERFPPLPLNWRYPPRVPCDQNLRKSNNELTQQRPVDISLPDLAMNQGSQKALMEVRDLDNQLETYSKQYTSLNRVSHSYQAKIKKLRSLNANRTAICNRNVDREAAIRREDDNTSLMSRIKLNELALNTKYYMEIKSSTKKLADSLASEERNVNAYLRWLDKKILDLSKRRSHSMIDAARELERVRSAPLPALDDELPNDPFRCIKLAMKTSQECSICLEQRYGKDLIFMGRCMHAFCVLCYHKVKTNSSGESNIIDGNQLDRCPMCNCTDVTPLRFKAIGEHYELFTV